MKERRRFYCFALRGLWKAGICVLSACGTQAFIFSAKLPNEGKTQLGYRESRLRYSDLSEFKKVTTAYYDQEVDTSFYIKFSDNFQRHVVFRGGGHQLPHDINIREKSARFASHFDSKDLLDYRTHRDCFVLESFKFLDEARQCYPNATILATPLQIDSFEDVSALSSWSLRNFSKQLEDTESNYTNRDEGASKCKDEGFGELIETDVKNSGLYKLAQLLCIMTNNSTNGESAKLEDTARKLRKWIGINRFRRHDAKSIHYNYGKLIALLTGNEAVYDWCPSSSRLAFSNDEAHIIIRSFPKLCLYDINDIAERVRFFLSPMAPVEVMQKCSSQAPRNRGSKRIDWPLALTQGYGAGICRQSLLEAIRILPEILSMQYEDSRKPPAMFFYQQYGVLWNRCDDVRNALPIMAGCDASDTCCFALLHSKLGISWDSLRIAVDALPTMVFAGLEVSWEVDGPSRSALKEESVNYLLRRLQISPLEVQGMIKTHSRLSGYDKQGKLRPSLDAVQSRLALSSSDLRRTILRMPSLLGMGTSRNPTSALSRRLRFFLEEVGMSQTELRNAIKKQPSLLQYSVETNLRPKLHFLTTELSILKTSVPRIIEIAPALLGSSLSDNLRPTAAFLMQRCDLTADEVGISVTTSPLTLLLSVQRKLERSLAFLESALLLSNKRELGFVILCAPRILLHSVETSLAPKLSILRNAIEIEQTFVEERLYKSPAPFIMAATLMKRNPALLVSSTELFRTRLEKELRKSDCSLWRALRPSTRGRKRQYREIGESSPKQSDHFDKKLVALPSPRKLVLELAGSRGEVVAVFPSIKVAAEKTSISLSALYAACRRGCSAKGRQFAYATRGENIKAFKPAETRKDNFMSSRISARISEGSLERALTKGISSGFEYSFSPESFLKNRISLDRLKIFESPVPTREISIYALASGRVIPSDNLNSFRGERRAGGLAIYFPQFHDTPTDLQEKFIYAADLGFGLVVPQDYVTATKDRYSAGLACLGFPFLRPSRRRCDLYACHAALKLSLQLLKNSDSDLRNANICIQIFTDSTYAWNQLSNVERLSRWAEARSLDTFLLACDFDSGMPVALRNPDLLYPLCQTYKRITRGWKIDDNKKGGEGQYVSLGNVRIEFCLMGDQTSVRLFSRTDWDMLSQFAYRAASWQYDRARQVTDGCESW